MNHIIIHASSPNESNLFDLFFGFFGGFFSSSSSSSPRSLEPPAPFRFRFPGVDLASYFDDENERPAASGLGLEPDFVSGAEDWAWAWVWSVFDVREGGSGSGGSPF